MSRYGDPDMECRGGVCRERRCRSNLECHMGAACLKGACVDVAKVRIPIHV